MNALTARVGPAAAALGTLVLGLAAQAPSRGADADPVAQALADVRYLADDRLEGRGIGTAGLDSAAAYIAGRFREIGLAPGGTQGYFQPFTLDPSAPALAHAGIGAISVRNVVASLPGAGPLADEVVLLGAHYDHLGRGGPGSLDPDSTGVVHNGADDNASGVAALLAAAEALKRRAAPRRHRTIVFAAFAAEELGLLGAQYLARHPPYAPRRTAAMLNFDMVGRLQDSVVMVIGTGSAREFPALVRAAAHEQGLTVTLSPDPWGRSDHSAFYAQRIPVLHFFTNTHSDYHRTTDDWEKINPQGIVRIAHVAADIAWRVATMEEHLTLLDIQAPAPATGGGYGAWLGTIPDMSGSPGGVRITGVRAGSPAEAAGLKGGDIITKLGRFDVRNLYDLTDALRAYSPGDTVEIVILRDQAQLRTRATLGRRGG